MNNKFSENLKKIRKEHNLSQEQLADEIGVSRQAISKWESAVAYPEMDKIIALCDKFNLNIDDLLHRDIREVKKEEESKKKLNNYINEFLNFITDTVNLFSSMKFKDKIKCLFEQSMIIIFLLIISCILSEVFNALTFSLFSFMPNKIRYFISNTLVILFIVLCIVFSIITIIHIFKIRYLNYYNDIKKNTNENNGIEKDTKIELKNEENKIIIRDPKHSEYKFINGLFKLVILTIKFFLLCFGMFIGFILISLFGVFISSFMVYKTGLFFIGLLISILSLSTIAVIILLLILNFVFNRENNKKTMIWGFIISLILFGIGCGLIFVGALNFDVLEENETLLKTEIREYEMKEDMMISSFNQHDIEYVESNNDNLKIEYKIDKYCEIEEINLNSNTISAMQICNNPIKLAREFVKQINNKKIIVMDSGINKITVYTTKTNIDKLKNNAKKHYIESRKNNELINSYEKEINNLSMENNELREKLFNLERQLEQ